MLKAIVVFPNEGTNEFGSLLAVARAEARKRERSLENPPIRALVYLAEIKVFVGVYEIPESAPQSIQVKK